MGARRSVANGPVDQVIGRSRSGRITKFHALTYVIGRLSARILTPGSFSDVTAAPALLERAGLMRHLLEGNGYNADRLCRLLREASTVPGIPGRRIRKRVFRHNKQRNQYRSLNENSVFRLNNFRHIATRYDNLAANIPVHCGARNRRSLLTLIETEPFVCTADPDPSAPPSNVDIKC